MRLPYSYNYQRNINYLSFKSLYLNYVKQGKLIKNKMEDIAYDYSRSNEHHCTSSRGRNEYKRAPKVKGFSRDVSSP